MRDAFVRGLCALAEAHEDVFLITGDLGFGVLTPFKEAFPKQYLNAGVAEQAMTGIAAGLALEGRTVFTYSIGNFPTLRCLEQIRNDCAYHGANVKVICVGGGFVYGALGMSHHATEDVAVMRALPEVTVFTPGDPYEAEAIVPLLYDTPGVCYLRLGRGGEPRVHPGAVTPYRAGQALPIYKGRECAIFSSGGILPECRKAADVLRAEGRDIALVSFPTVKPIDTPFIRSAAASARLIITVEEHNVIGGFGGAVSEIVAEMGGSRAMVARVGLQDCYSAVVGSQAYLRAYYGLDSAGIAARVRALTGEAHG
jgi:transketolase